VLPVLEVKHLCNEASIFTSWLTCGAVPFSRLALGRNGGKSGRVGFSSQVPKYRAKLTEAFYDRFSHGSATFLFQHVEEVWAPFLLEQPFQVRNKILRQEVLAWIQRPRLPEGISFLRRLYNCRIDRMGNYFARYESVARNSSDTNITHIPIYVAMDSTESLSEILFTVLDEKRRHLDFTVTSDELHTKHVDVSVGVIRPKKTTSIAHFFRISRAMKYSGDIDFFDIHNTTDCEVWINSFYRLSGVRAFTVRSDRLIDELLVNEKEENNQTYSYSIAHQNKLNDDGILFYYEGTLTKVALKWRILLSARSSPMAQ
jgi:hypothetical protein